MRGNRSELYVVVRWVCGINWQGTVLIANFDIKGFLAFVFTHLCLLFLFVIQTSVFVAGADPSCHSVLEALSS